jgi:hypothetical protein
MRMHPQTSDRVVSLKFVTEANAGPSTAFGRKRPNFAQDDGSFSGANFNSGHLGQ